MVGIYKDIKIIGAEYEKGASLKELTSKYGWSEMTIQRALKKNGHRPRRTGPRKSKRYEGIRNDILKTQDGRCAVCGVSYLEQDLDLDHCHESGRVRGFLCHGCNILVGHLENTDRKKKALEYLTQEPLEIMYEDV